MKFTSIRNKMIFTISLFVTILLITIAFGAYAYFRNVTRELIFNHQFSLLSNEAKALDYKIVSSHNALIAISKVTPSNAFGNREITQKWLENRVGVRSLFNHGLYVFDATGMLVASFPQVKHLRGSSFSDHEFFKSSKNSGKPYISSPFLSKIDQNPVISMTVPLLTENGAMKGLLCGEINILSKDNLLGELSQVRLGSSGYMYLFARDRTIIMHPDNSRIMKKDVLPGVNKLFDKALEGFEGSDETINSKGLPFLTSFKRLQSTGWILAANYPLEDAMQSLTSFSNYYSAGMLMMILIAIGLTWKLGIGIATPLTNLSAQVRDLAHTDSVTSRRIESKHVDEIGILADSFNSLLDVLRQREQKYRDLFESSKDGIVQTDMQGIIQDANVAYLDMLDYSKEELKLLTYKQLTPLKWHDMEDKIVRNQITLRGYSDEYEKEYIKKDGCIIPITLRTWLIVDEHANNLGMWAVVRDISERKRAEAAFRESEERYKALFDRSLDCVYVHDFEGNFLDANDAALNLLGYKREELPSLNFAALLSDDQMPRALQALQETMDNGFQKNVAGYRMKRKDGEDVHLETIASVILREGKPYAIQGIARDITERKQAEDALEEERRRLQQALDEVRTLRGIVPICANCKKIRDDKGYWNQVEKYVSERTEAQFSHGICPDCVKVLYPDLYKK